MEKLQLEYFLSVAQTLNISKSAELLHISQPSLSQTIKKLETEIGYPLFDRSGKHITLNHNGIIFLNCVQKMKQLYENALEEIAENHQIKNKKIAINVQCASYFLPQLMLYMEEALPDSTFQIFQQNHSGSGHREADLTITAVSRPLHDDCASLLLEENILLAIPKNHRLYQRQSISVSDLDSENFISLNPQWLLQKMITEECRRINFEPKILIQVDNPDLLRRLIAKKLGLAFVPEKAWGNLFANGEFDLRTVSDFTIKRYVYVIRNEGFIRDNVHQCILCIQKFFLENLHG